MGRYIFGDIEGKCAVGLQSSNFADRFGKIGYQPEYLEYIYSREDIPDVKRELKSMRKVYGRQFAKIRLYFKDKNTYSTADMAEALNLTVDELIIYLREFYDYRFGIRLLEKLCNLEDDYADVRFSVEL